MGTFKVDFDSLAWQPALPGARYKVGVSSAHRARSLTPVVRLVLVEEV